MNMDLLNSIEQREGYEVDSTDWPRCEQCDMPVELFRVEETSNSLVLIAYCHGDIERVELPDEIWTGVLTTNITLGPAFKGEHYD